MDVGRVNRSRNGDFHQTRAAMILDFDELLHHDGKSALVPFEHINALLPVQERKHGCHVGSPPTGRCI